MACLMKFGALPAAANLDQPTAGRSFSDEERP